MSRCSYQPVKDTAGGAESSDPRYPHKATLGQLALDKRQSPAERTTASGSPVQRNLQKCRGNGRFPRSPGTDRWGHFLGEGRDSGWSGVLWTGGTPHSMQSSPQSHGPSLCSKAPGTGGSPDPKQGQTQFSIPKPSRLAPRLGILQSIPSQELSSRLLPGVSWRERSNSSAGLPGAE